MKLLTTAGLTELITKIKAALATKVSSTDVVSASTVDIDSAPTSASTNLVTSGGVYSAIASADKLFTITASSVTASGFSVDKTTTEVLAAITAGKIVILNITTLDSNVYRLNCTQYKADATALNFENTVSGDNTVFQLSAIQGTTTYEGFILDKVLNSVSVSSTGTSTDEVGYITIDGTEKKIASGSSGGNFIVTFTASGSTYTADKTFAQTTAAYNAGQNVVGVLNGNVYTMYSISSSMIMFNNVDVMLNTYIVIDSSNAVDTAYFQHQAEHTATTATLTAAGWSSSTQTVTVSGVTSSNTVIISPAPASTTAYANAGIYASAQGTDSITFTCTTTPTAAITVNVVILD